MIYCICGMKILLNYILSKKTVSSSTNGFVKVNVLFFLLTSHKNHFQSPSQGQHTSHEIEKWQNSTISDQNTRLLFQKTIDIEEHSSKSPEKTYWWNVCLLRIVSLVSKVLLFSSFKQRLILKVKVKSAA